MGFFDGFFGCGDNGTPRETKEALRNTARRDAHMKQVAREARKSLFSKDQDDRRADNDRRDGGFWSW